MKFRKLVAYCKKCNRINFMSVYDTADEILDAAPDIHRIREGGRKLDIIFHDASDDMPKLSEWCGC